jgi:hypothetical protein
VQFNSREGTVTPIDFDPQLPQINQPSMMAFDSRRQRLLVSPDVVLDYDLRARKWSLLRSLQFGSSAFGYSARDDVFYMVSGDRGDRWILDRYSPFGVRMSHLDLRFSPPQGDEAGRCQVVDVGEYVGIITRGRILASPQSLIWPKLYLVKPDTGDLVYSGPLVETTAEKRLSSAELASAWERLASAQVNEAKETIEKLAAGGPAVVSFINARISSAKPPKPENIAALIERLGAANFDQREKAERELGQWGALVQEALTRATEHTLPEVRTRARRLLGHLSDAAIKNPVLRREARAMDVLGRIGSAEALETLEYAALGPVAPVVAGRARRVLVDLGEGAMTIDDALSTPGIAWGRRN